MDLRLLNEDDPLLRQVATAWDFEKDGSPKDLVYYMSVLMRVGNGIGLAAPQCGISKRLFIIWNREDDSLAVCINPKIISGEGSVQDTEGCLSFPKLWLHVKRMEKINVEFYNLDGIKEIVELEGLAARVFQHELDHLDGVCFDTKVPKLSLKMAKNRRNRGK